MDYIRMENNAKLRCSGWMRRSRNFLFTIMITTVILWGGN